MSMIINDNKLVIELPNSEATINAQHKGIKDRTVSGYYLSESYENIYNFLNGLKGNFYIDFIRTYTYLENLYKKIENEKFEIAFKFNLEPQKASLQSIEHFIGCSNGLYKISNPTINENKKYLKFPSFDMMLNDFKDICLGDLTNIIIEKLGHDTFIIYSMDNMKLDMYIKNKKILDWMK